jgi:predicted nucleic acid-binding protein
MSIWVVDASVAIKWFIPETGTADALRLRQSQGALHAPEFLSIEIANILWKKCRRGELSRADADAILAQLPTLPLTRHPEGPLLAAAFDLAERAQRSVYDCLYLALAVQLGGQMVSADERLVNSLAGTPWAGSILRLQDVP